MKLRNVILFCVLLTSVRLVGAQPAAGSPYRPDVIQDKWTYSITPYVWALGVSGSVSHNSRSLGKVNLSPGDLLSNIKMAGMIVAEAHHQRFGLYVDAMYGDLGKTSSKVVGRADLSANTSINMTMVTLAPSYTLHHSSSLYLDGLIGARYFGMSAKTSISDSAFGLSLNESSNQNITAAVAGLKGRWNLGNSNYFVPFYIDVGGGQHSSFTSQAYLGIGRSFEWGDVSLVAKNVYYQYKPNNNSVDMNMFGAAVAVTFRF